MLRDLAIPRSIRADALPCDWPSADFDGNFEDKEPPDILGNDFAVKENSDEHQEEDLWGPPDLVPVDREYTFLASMGSFDSALA